MGISYAHVWSSTVKKYQFYKILERVKTGNEALIGGDCNFNSHVGRQACSFCKFQGDYEVCQ